jgi:hypothetical protein
LTNNENCSIIIIENKREVRPMTVVEMIDLIEDLIKEYGKENVLTTLKSIIDFYEKNT